MASTGAGTGAGKGSVGYAPNKLDFPEIELERFQHRMYSKLTLAADIELVHVASVPSGVHKTSYEYITKHGIWISFGDAIPRGQVSSVYGFHLSERIVKVLTLYSDSIESWLAASASTDGALAWPLLRPLVVYHGTHKDTSKQILHEGLKPSFGMLGHAIYFGSFWKAFRFATLTQDYKPRPGAIMRYYAFWPKVYERNLYGPCCCARCSATISAGSSATSRGPLIADHDSEWAKHAPAVLVVPEAGKPISNEEFASTNDSMVLLESIAYAESTTTHHEPLNRNLQII